MDNMKKTQEIKAHNIATTIFDFHMESDIFAQLDVAEKLQLLSEKVDILKKKFKSKPFAQLVAKRILWIIEDYVQEKGLCPDCFLETSYVTVTRQTYWQPEDRKMVCHHCGWSEACKEQGA